MLVGSIEYVPNYDHDPFAATAQQPYTFPPIHKPPLAANDNRALPRVVALTGPAGSGKSTLAEYLTERYSYQRVKFAGPLKEMCRAIGMTDAMIEGKEKELPSDLLCGRTPRWAMQTLGTQWGRDLIGEDFWINLWLRQVRTVLASNGNVICDDCRFDNEVEAVHSVGGVVVQLQGRGGIAGAHSSETPIDDPDFVLHNTGSIYDLKNRADELLFSVG